MVPQLAENNSEARILSRATDPQNWKLTPEAARSILALELSPKDRERMDELAAKSPSGSLTADEEVEIESYRQVATLVELIKSKARLFLKTAGLEP